MILFDVNVLLNAHRSGQEDHAVARELLEEVVNAPAPFALSELVLVAFVRIATNRRAFAIPTSLETALRVAGACEVAPMRGWCDRESGTGRSSRTSAGAPRRAAR